MCVFFCFVLFLICSLFSDSPHITGQDIRCDGPDYTCRDGQGSYTRFYGYFVLTVTYSGKGPFNVTWSYHSETDTRTLQQDTDITSLASVSFITSPYSVFQWNTATSTTGR